MAIDKYLLDEMDDAKLSNISNNLFSYLTMYSGTIVDIDNNFDFNTYKEIVRNDLYAYSMLYEVLETKKSNNIINEIVEDKKELKGYIDELLSNDIYLNNFTIYKIQQFINDVVSNVSFMKKSYNEKYTKENPISRLEKSIDYNGNLIKVSLVGFVNKANVANSLYKSFGIARMKKEDYQNALQLKGLDEVKNNKAYLDVVNSLLFKNGVDYIDGEIVYIHPSNDDDFIMECIRNNDVARKINSKTLVYTKDEE